MKRTLFAVVGAVLLSLSSMAGRAVAVWTSNGSTGHATVRTASLQPAVADPVAGPVVPPGGIAGLGSTAEATALFPGTPGDVVLFVDNPNSYSVQISELAPGEITVDADHVGCDNAKLAIRLVNDGSPYPVVPARAADFKIVRLGTALLAANAENICQGARFTFVLTMTVIR